MFFDEERILSFREMILSKTKEDRAKALEKLLPHQKKDFVEIFKIIPTRDRQIGGHGAVVKLIEISHEVMGNGASRAMVAYQIDLIAVKCGNF